MDQESIPEIGVQQIDVILAFLPIFEGDDYSFGEWVNKEGQIPYIDESPEVREFHQALYREQIIIVFKWTKWGDELERYQSDPEVLQSADLLSVRKILTAHARADRFVEGHMVSVLKRGHVIAVLRRLKTIRDEMVATN